MAATLSLWAYSVPIISAVLFLFRKQLLNILIPPGIPGVPNLPGSQPILGDLITLGKWQEEIGDATSEMYRASETLGPLYLIRLSYIYKMLILTDYDEVERLLVSNKSLEKAALGRNNLSPLLPKALVSLRTNDMWKHHYRIMGPSMTSKYLSLATHGINESISEAIELFKLKIEKSGGRPWDASLDTEATSMDAIWSVTFGESCGNVKAFRQQIKQQISETAPIDNNGAAVFQQKMSPIAQSTMHVFESCPLQPPMNAVIHFFTRLTPSYRKHNGILQSYLRKRVIDARTKAKAMGAEAAVETAHSTLDMMVSRELKGDDFMPEDEMKQELLEYLVAGTETTGVYLLWWMKYMTEYPEIHSKLRQHLLDSCPEIMDKPPAYDDLNATKTPYLEAIVWETFRLSRTAGGFARETIEDTIICGKMIPKGTQIIIPSGIGAHDESNREPSYGAQTSAIESKRRVGYWKAGTGSLFQPERWLDDEGKFDPHAGPSLHFGMGQRSCFGKNLALLEVRLFIAQVTMVFSFAPVPENLRGREAKETVARHPLKPFIRPVPWPKSS